MIRVLCIDLQGFQCIFIKAHVKMRILQVTIWMVVLRMLTANDMEDMTIIQEEKGIVLTGIGLLAGNADPIYISTFVKIKDPTVDENLCMGICELTWEQKIGRVNALHCDGMDNRIGTEENILDNVMMDRGQMDMNVTTDCFELCLKHTECHGFGIKPQGIDQANCILRSKFSEKTIFWNEGKEFNMDCIVPNKTDYCQNWVSSMTKLIWKENGKYVKSTMEDIEDMIETLDHKTSRNKRFAGAIMGGLGMVASGFALFETYQLRQHIQLLDTEFEKFRTEVRYFEEAQISFNENILRMYKVLETRIEKGLETLECNLRNLAYQMLFSRRLLEWKAFIDVISKDLISGQLIGSVSPKLFSKSDVDRILQKEELGNTIYARDIGLFYRLSRSWVSKITKDGDMYNLHIVLSIPNIKADNVFPMYKARSVGLINGTICSNIKLPDIVYKKEENFYGLTDPDNCQERGNIKLCLRKKGDKEAEERVKCLSSDHMDCEIYTERCYTRNIQTTAGVMIRVLGKLQAATNNNPNKYMDILNGPGTKFLNYNTYSDISADNIIVKAIQEPTLIKILPLENITGWNGYLEEKYEGFKRTNLQELRKDIDVQKEILDDLDDAHFKPITSKILIGLNYGLWVIGVLTVTSVVLYCYCNCGSGENGRNKEYEMVDKREEEKTELEEGIELETMASSPRDEEVGCSGRFEEDRTTSLAEDGIRKRASSNPDPKDERVVKFYKIGPTSADS